MYTLLTPWVSNRDGTRLTTVRRTPGGYTRRGPSGPVGPVPSPVDVLADESFADDLRLLRWRRHRVSVGAGVGDADVRGETTVPWNRVGPKDRKEGGGDWTDCGREEVSPAHRDKAQDTRSLG